MRKSASLQFRLSLWVGLVMLALGVLLVVAFAWVARREARRTASYRMEVVAMAQAEAIRTRFESAIAAARTVAQTLAVNLEPGHRLDRRQVNALLRKVLEGNREFLGVYTAWEPDAFDGEDARHRGDPDADPSGRLAPYWNRGLDGSIQVEPIVDHDVPGLGDFYQIPKERHREAVIEPYRYNVRGQPVLMTSMVVPILDPGGRFRGIAGVDLRIDFLQRLADGVDVYDHAGKLVLLTCRGMVAGATGQPERVGRPWAWADRVPGANGSGVMASGTFSRDGFLYARTPIRIGRTPEPWVVLLQVPERVVMAPVVRRIMAMAGGGAALMALGIACTLLLLRRTVVAKVERLTAATESLTAGNYQVDCALPGHDELHRLGRAFNAMAARIAESVSVLQEREALLKGALDQSLEFYALLTPAGDLEFCNRTALDVIAADLGAVLGRPFWDLPWCGHSPQVQAEVRLAIQRAAQGGAFRCETTNRWADGQVRPLDFALTPLRDPAGAIIHLIAEGRDLTEERRVGQALASSEEKYRHIVEHAPVGVFRVRLDGRFDYANPGVLKQFECESLEELNRLYGDARSRWADPGQALEVRERLLARKEVQGVEAEVRLKNGKSKWHLVYAYLEQDGGLIEGFLLDTTEQRRLREQLNQSQKMEAVGQLAGGVAHDFNNSLTVIMNAAELLRDDSLPLEVREKYLDLVLHAADRAGQLTRKLLAFSRKAAKSSTALDVLAIVNDTAAILRRTLDKRIAVSVENAATCTRVVGDDALLSNAFLNMGINAGHAMPEGGSLVFRLEDAPFGQAPCERSLFPLAPGTYLRVSVRDTGCGMPPEVLARIFEPFFTTREPGKGTGLGLAAVYGTVQDHHGAITVESEPGAGTVFHVLLPLAPEARLAAAPEVALRRGAGTLLVIDDEELMRVTARALLESLGYTVLTAGDGAAGLALFQERRGEIRLVILDMIMPVMGGRDTYRRIRELDPEVPVIVCSGFSKDGPLLGMSEPGAARFLAKPFRRAELAAVVAEALGGVGV